MLALMDIRNRIVEIAVKEPELVNSCVSRLLATPEGRRAIAAFCDSLGRSYARHLLQGLKEEDWRVMDLIVRQGPQSEADALLELHRELLCEMFTARTRAEESDPFAFIDSLSVEIRAKVLGSQPPGSLALISAFRNSMRMSEILETLPKETRRRTVLEISLLQKLPAEVMRAVALGFSEKLQKESAVFAASPPPFRMAPPPKPEPLSPRVQEAIERLQKSREMERKILSFLQRETPALRSLCPESEQNTVDRKLAELSPPPSSYRPKDLKKN